MLNAWNVLVSQSNYPDLYQIYDKDSMLAKNLYNAAMFRIRQTFTGWDKTSRTDHENEVFEEIRITKQTYPGLKIKRVLRRDSPCRQRKRSFIRLSTISAAG